MSDAARENAREALMYWKNGVFQYREAPEWVREFVQWFGDQRQAELVLREVASDAFQVHDSDDADIIRYLENAKIPERRPSEREELKGIDSLENKLRAKLRIGRRTAASLEKTDPTKAMAAQRVANRAEESLRTLEGLKEKGVQVKLALDGGVYLSDEEGKNLGFAPWTEESRKLKVEDIQWNRNPNISLSLEKDERGHYIKMSGAMNAKAYLDGKAKPFHELKWEMDRDQVRDVIGKGLEQERERGLER